MDILLYGLFSDALKQYLRLRNKACTYDGEGNEVRTYSSLNMKSVE